MGKKKIQFEVTLHILAGIVLALSSVMIWMGYGQDIEFHAERIAAIAAEMKIHGPGIYRIYSTVCEGYGYASPMFYGDIFLYLPAALTALGLGVGITFRLYLASIMAGAYLSMYFCVKAVWNKRTAVTAAYLYAFSPILLADIFIRFAVGEAMAFVFIPIVLFGFYRIVLEPVHEKTDWIYLALGMSGLIFSHIISTVLTVILLALLCILNVKKLWKRKRAIAGLALAALLTVGITAYFTLPMLEQMMHSKFYVINRQTSNLAGNVVPAAGLLFGSEYVSILNRLLEKLTGAEDFFSTSWFPGGFGYLLFAVLIFRFRKKKGQRDQFTDALLGLSVLYLIISMVPLIQPLLEPFIGFIKIPWRHLTFYMLFLSLGAALLFVKLWKDGKEKQYRLGMLSGTFGTLTVFLALVLITFHNGMFPFETLSTNSIGLGEYLPSEVGSYDYAKERGEEVKCNNEDVVYTWERKDGYFELFFENNSKRGANFEVPLYMYYGYAVENVDTGGEYTPVVSPNGLVQFAAEGESGSVRIYYKGTALQKISCYISLAALLGSAFALWMRRKKLLYGRR